MLVITEAHRQEGAAPKLQQPSVQLLGHEIEPTGIESEAWTGASPGLVMMRASGQLVRAEGTACQPERACEAWGPAMQLVLDPWCRRVRVFQGVLFSLPAPPRDAVGSWGSHPP